MPRMYTFRLDPVGVVTDSCRVSFEGLSVLRYDISAACIGEPLEFFLLVGHDILYTTSAGGSLHKLPV